MSGMTHILAIDPGLRTGIALTRFEDDEPAELVASWDVPGGVDGFIEWLDATWDADPYRTGAYFVVYEKFIPREGRHGVGTDASEVIGALLYWAKKRWIPAVSQPPAGRMKAVPNEVLDKFHKFSGNKDRNVKEAFRHSLWYLKNAQHMPTIYKGWSDGNS